MDMYLMDDGRGGMQKNESPGEQHRTESGFLSDSISLKILGIPKDTSRSAGFTNRHGIHIFPAYRSIKVQIETCGV